MLKKFRKTKTYFAKAFLHTAGQHAQGEITMGFFWFGMCLGVILSTLLIFLYLKFPDFQGFIFPIVFILPVLSIVGIPLAIRHINFHWQGKQGEKVVRDEIEPLIKQDYHIFNDVPGKNFNIDFMVVGPSGIYVIEVKNPSKTHGDDKISYKNGQVCLNDRPFKKKKPVEQVRRSANWLNEKLRHVDGHKADTIKPVVLFPNFLVDEYAGDFWLMNPKRFVSHYVPVAPKVLNTSEIDKYVGMLRMYISENDPFQNDV